MGNGFTASNEQHSCNICILVRQRQTMAFSLIPFFLAALFFPALLPCMRVHIAEPRACVCVCVVHAMLTSATDPSSLSQLTSITAQLSGAATSCNSSSHTSVTRDVTWQITDAQSIMK